MLVLLALFRTDRGKRAVRLLGKYQNRALRAISLLVVALALIGNAIYLVNRTSPGDAQGARFGAIEVLASGFTVIKAKSCQDASCWQPYVDDLIVVGLSAAAEDNTQSAPELVEQLVDEVVADTDLGAAEINMLKKMVNDRLATQLAQNKIAVKKSPGPPAPITETEPSPLAWVYGLLNDLGLGFGFSAVYFSCFTAWFSGQTLGKKLLNIQVIQLNNTPLSLWDAFGRYGGYGAGLATGLLGFVQIYWDYNRQAIQDKIAATVVIDLGLIEKALIERDLKEKALK